jgi:hypothetical protein
MKTLLESPADIPSDQILGFVCELAIEDVILNRGIDMRPVPEAIINYFSTRHKTIAKRLLKSSKEYIINVAKFYNLALSATNTAFGYQIGICENNKVVNKTIRDIVGGNLQSSAAGSTSPYDVVTDTAYLHVKLNQSSVGERLIGFQGNIENLASHTVDQLRDIKGTVFGNSYHAKVKQVFGQGGPGYTDLKKVIVSELKKDMMNETAAVLDQMAEILLSECVSDGKILKPGDSVRKSKQPYTYPSSLTAKNVSYDFEVDWNVWWPFIKETYKSIFKKYFSKIVDAKADQLILLNDIKAKLVGEPSSSPSTKSQNRVILFMNFEGNINDLTLVVNKYQLQSCGTQSAGELKLDWINDGTKQPYGLIWINSAEFGSPSKDNVLYYIEIRTDGEGHPPQLKIGGALKSEKFLNVFIYKAAQASGPAKPVVTKGKSNISESTNGILKKIFSEC